MKLWERFLDELENELGKEAVDKWLRPLGVAAFDAGNIYLDTPDAFQIAWFKEHVAPLAKRLLLSGSGRPIKIHIRPKTKRQAGHPEKTTSHADFPSDPLEDDATRESFLPQSDSLGHTLMLKLIDGEMPLASFNPISLCGESGSGKSHLLMATARHFRNQGKAVQYVTGESFAKQVVRAFRFGGIGAFREWYRKVDLLLIDGIEALARQWATQEELFHTFNALHTEKQQIIVSSRAPVATLEEIEKRLVSRFEWGIQGEMLRPDTKALVTATLTNYGIAPTDELIEWLVEAFTTPTYIKQGVAALRMRLPNRDEIALVDAKHHLSDLQAAHEKSNIEPRDIIAAVAKEFDVSQKELLSPSRKKELATARHIAIFLCRKELSLPLMHIGKVFRRDHSTVMSSIERVTEWLQAGRYSEEIDSIKSAFTEEKQ